MDKETPTGDGERRLIVLILAIAAFLRCFKIGSQSFWVDEILTLKVISDPQPGVYIWDYLLWNIHGPLHMFVVYLFHFFSMWEGWLRLPSALAGVGVVYYFYQWISLWIGRRFALSAAALLAINPMLIYYSQELRNYSFLLLFAMMANYYFYKLLAENTRRKAVIYGVTIALAALSNFSAFFLFVSHTLIYFIRQGMKRATVFRWIGISVLILVLISPWVYRIYTFIDVSKLVTPVMPGEISTTTRLRGETTFTLIAVPYSFYTFSVGFSLGPSLRYLHENTDLAGLLGRYGVTIALVTLSFGLLALMGFYRYIKAKSFWWEMAIFLLVPIALTLLLCWQNAKAFNTRYVILSVAPFVCLVANGIFGIRKKVQVVLVAGAVAALSLASAGNYYFDGEYAREDIRGAARYVNERVKENDCLLVPSVTMVFDYYFRLDNPRYRILGRTGVSQERVDRQLEEFFARCNDFWYLRARTWLDDPRGYVLASIRRHYREREVRIFDGIELYRFSRRQPSK